MVHWRQKKLTKEIYSTIYSEAAGNPILRDLRGRHGDRILSFPSIGALTIACSHPTDCLLHNVQDGANSVGVGLLACLGHCNGPQDHTRSGVWGIVRFSQIW